MNLKLYRFSTCLCISIIIIILVNITSSSTEKFSTTRATEISDELEALAEIDFKSNKIGISSFEDSLRNDNEDFNNSVQFFVINRTRNAQPIVIGKSKTLKNLLPMQSHPIKILIHGFMGECKGENFPGKLVEAYFHRENLSDGKNTYTLICVDWKTLSYFGKELSARLYKSAINNAVFVGKRLALFLKFLIDHNVTSLNKIHMIGYSLGAHCAGVAGYYLHRHYNEKVGRISGLDPAGPLYDLQALTDQLDSTDAEFVDILHTNSGKLGISKKIGHVDFYPNGGKKQPQCLKTGDPMIDLYESVTGVCSHQIAPEFYSKSIINSSIKACICKNSTQNENSVCENCESDSKVLTFGEFCPTGATGNYYLQLI